MPPLSDPLPSRRDPTRRVLVVEDYADMAKVLTWLLRLHHFETQTIRSGELAYPAALTFRPYAILLDISLPVLDGFEVAELIRADATLDDTLLIALSAYGPDMHRERQRRARFDHYFVKPVDFDHLLPLLAG